MTETPVRLTQRGKPVLVGGKFCYMADLFIKINAPIQANDESLFGAYETWPTRIREQLESALDRFNRANASAYTIREARVDETPEHGWFIHALAVSPVYIA